MISLPSSPPNALVVPRSVNPPTIPDSAHLRSSNSLSRAKDWSRHVSVVDAYKPHHRLVIELDRQLGEFFSQLVYVGTFEDRQQLFFREQNGSPLTLAPTNGRPVVTYER